MKPIKFQNTESFERALNKAPIDIQDKVIECLEKIKQGQRLRLHRLTDKRPPVWKFDVLPNKSWQVALRIDGNVYTLLDLGTHKYMDRKKSF